MGDEIYNSLRPESYSLEGFNDLARRLYDGSEGTSAEEDRANFMKFVLTGDVLGDRQAVVDPHRNYMLPGQINFMRDYDSIIGISDEIEPKCMISLCPVSNAIDSLTASIHLEHEILDDSGTVSMPCLSA
jgi:hypothetical protein